MAGISVARLLAAGALICATQAGPVSANPASEALIREALPRMEQSDYAGALATLNRAMQADRNDGRVAFYQGYTLNRMGQPGPAFASFERMRSLGTSHPQADYEEGWAAVATGRWPQAVALLEPYERANPTNGLASEFLGRAYIATGRLNDAEAALNRAMERDPRTKDTALLHLAEIKALRGQTREAMTGPIDQLMRESAESPIGVAVAQSARREAARYEDDKPWFVYLGQSFGRNSNVIAFPSATVRPADITHTDSWFSQTEFGGQYEFRILPVSTLTAGYSGSYNAYFEIDNQNTVDQNIFGQYKHVIFRELTGTFTLGGGKGWVDGSTYVDSWNARPSLVFEPIQNLAIEPFFAFAHSNQQAAQRTPQFLDRDADVHSWGVKALYFWPDIASTVQGGIARLYNHAEGSDFDYRATQFSLGLTTSLPYQITSDINFAHTYYDYSNLNSLAINQVTGAAFNQKRSDHVVVFSTRLSRPIWGPASGFFQYDYADDDSNIASYGYKQHQVRFGVLARY